MKTIKAYKLCRLKDGKIYPLYVCSHEELVINQLLHAKVAPNDGKHIDSKLGKLALRPGFHCCDVPDAKHIGKRVDGHLVRRKDSVWCEVEINANTNYTGTNQVGPSGMRVIPHDGFYCFRTNGRINKNVVWYITSDIRITKILTDEEVAEKCRERGIEPQRKED